MPFSGPRSVRTRIWVIGHQFSKGIMVSKTGSRLSSLQDDDPHVDARLTHQTGEEGVQTLLDDLEDEGRPFPDGED